MVRRAIIKHDGTRRGENIWHWWTGAGRTSTTPRLPFVFSTGEAFLWSPAFCCASSDQTRKTQDYLSRWCHHSVQESSGFEKGFLIANLSSSILLRTFSVFGSFFFASFLKQISCKAAVNNRQHASEELCNTEKFWTDLRSTLVSVYLSIMSEWLKPKKKLKRHSQASERIHL